MSPRCSNSAAANAENNHDLAADDLVRRRGHGQRRPDPQALRPRAQGRAFAIHKPMTHITVVVENREA